GAPDKLVRMVSGGPGWEDANGSSGWVADAFGTTFAKWGDYVVAAGIDTKVQYIDDTKGAGENFGDLCVTTAPTGATAGNTADLKARFVFPYRDHLVLANITPVSDYPASNTIYSANTNYGSLVWLSMSDNIRRYASPVAHPEVKGSLPMNLV